MERFMNRAWFSPVQLLRFYGMFVGYSLLRWFYPFPLLLVFELPHLPSTRALQARSILGAGPYSVLTFIIWIWQAFTQTSVSEFML